MKKHLKLCGEYLGSVRSNSVALCCVLSIAFTMIALLLGSYNYTYSRYLKFKSAEDDADGVYFMCTSIKPDDRETSREIIACLKELNQRDGITVVIVTHDREVAEVCHRIINISDGRITDIEALDA